MSRFGNSTISHQLSQIAWDGSQKLPFRVLGTVQDNLSVGRSVERLSLTIAAWFHFVRQRLADKIEIVDPLALSLERIGRSCTGNAETDIALFEALDSVFDPALYNEPRFRNSLCLSYGMIESLGAKTTIVKLLPRL